jgi:hypothetical protein
MNIASVRGLARLAPSMTALLLVSACATKSPSPPQMPVPPPSSPSTMPGSSPPKPGSPSSSPSSSSSASKKPGSASSSSSPSSSSSASKGSTSKPAGPAAGTRQASGAGGTQGAGAKGAGGASGGKTEAEQNAEWDEAFYGSLGEFDKRLSNEQAAIEKRRGEIAAAGNGRENGQTDGNGGGISGQVPSEVATSEAGGAPVSGTGSDASSQMGGLGAPAASGPKFPAPEGTPDGKDDDVVARQLREAAETEKDPELRARLWEEYRKYKSRKS